MLVYLDTISGSMPTRTTRIPQRRDHAQRRGPHRGRPARIAEEERNLRTTGGGRLTAQDRHTFTRQQNRSSRGIRNRNEYTDPASCRGADASKPRQESPPGLQRGTGRLRSFALVAVSSSVAIGLAVRLAVRMAVATA